MQITFTDSGGRIMLTACFDRVRLRMSTRIHPDTPPDQVAVSLTRIKSFFLEEYLRQKNSGTVPTKQTMTDAFHAYLGVKVKSATVRDHILVMSKSSQRAASTCRTYARLAALIGEFEADNYPVTYDRIGREFYDDLVTFLRARCLDTSIGTYIKALKSTLNDAFEQGITSCVEQKKKYFKVFTEDSDQVYLTDSEIQVIADIEIQDDELSYYRCLFVLACYTGLRYSDWHNFAPENLIESDTILRAVTRKTGAVVCIPLHPTARAMLRRVFKSPFEVPATYKMDRAVKRICRMAGIDSPVRKAFTQAGTKSSMTAPKWKLVSSHTARRSFTTNAYLAKVPVIDIMKFTGHQSDSAFRKYVRVSSQEAAMNNLSHPFFSGQQ